MTDLLSKVREEYYKALEVLEKELEVSLRARNTARSTTGRSAPDPAPASTAVEPEQPVSRQDRTALSQEYPESKADESTPEKRETPKWVIWVSALSTATAIAVLIFLLFIFNPAVNQYGMDMFDYIRQLVSPDNEVKHYYSDYNYRYRR